jgi:predicted transcriptional regulator of viral defense system
LTGRPACYLTNKIVSVTKGGWVPVPPVYRADGGPPPIHYIDYVMQHLGHPYYVGLLSAARIHGASHQVPMVLQVVTEAGPVTISTAETTVLDLVEAPERAAGLGNVANVLGEFVLDHRLDVAALAAAASRYPRTVVQRAGWLLRHMSTELDHHLDLTRLEPLVDGADYTALDLESGADGDRDLTWHVIENTEVEHDL